MSKAQELDVLNRRQCLDLLQEVRVGRLVFTEGALPAVQPVNFRLWRDDVVIRVAGGAKLAAAAENLVVAFEADELDPDLRTGWSVTVVGHAQPITDIDELVEIGGTFLQPWVDGRRDHFVRIRTERITGRRFREPGLPQYLNAANS
ncbi:pyridoxamine 5'-phosphate oxidase family protein [Mycobacterium neglectum]|jgi:nitroimidazol reductase NimA-like FMN-containing flavoprotein (pyridoxamine 5'-phosphate oxidase superfamily)|uniref:pyridoxamine 5'-phosphate oxidase family protein n=1 Tax=Mycobacterium neglectum TaxID=242737 RepID=UPI000BFEBD23|nr:pyridoxamine 5'-phosphate oxidase family protein [Mycobacterium neglectum]